MNIDFLKDVGLAVAQEQHLETIMKMIVERMNEEPDVLNGAVRVSSKGEIKLRIISGGLVITELAAHRLSKPRIIVMTTYAQMQRFITRKSHSLSSHLS